MSGGGNEHGELGRGVSNTSDNDKGNLVFQDTVDEAHQDLSTAVRNVISATASYGGYHASFVDGDGAVWAMGNNDVGQLGRQNLSGSFSAYATQVAGGFSVDGKTYEAVLVTPEDAAKAGLKTGFSATFDLSSNYTVHNAFNLLKTPAGYRDCASLNHAVSKGFSVKYATLDGSVAVVTADGQLQAKGYGTTTILVTVASDAAFQFARTLAFKVSVVKPYDTGRTETVTVDETTGETVEREVLEARAYAQVAVGEDYVLALKANGEVWAWGRDTYGQLGVGDGSRGGLESKPMQVRFQKVTGYRDPKDASHVLSVGEYARQKAAATVEGLALLNSYTKVYASDVKVAKVAAGLDFAMALDTEGNVYTWGRNNVGQIGNGQVSIVGDAARPEVFYGAPVMVEGFLGLKNSADVDDAVPIVDIYAGVVHNTSVSPAADESYALALSAEGDLFAWGSGASLQARGLGDNSGRPVTTPTYLNLSDLVDVAANSLTATYGLNQEGTVLTWDRSVNSVTHDPKVRAALRADGARAVDIDAGYGDLFVLTDKADVFTMGTKNESGQQGTGGFNAVNQPEKVLSNVAHISGGLSTLALTTDGHVLGTGRNAAGELGRGTDETGRDRVSDRESTFQNVLAGEAVDADDIYDSDWNLTSTGAMTQPEDDLATAVWADTSLGVPQARKDGASRASGLSSAITGDGSVFVWGANDYGQLGNIVIGKDPFTGKNYKSAPAYTASWYLALENEPDGMYSNKLVHLLKENEIQGEVYDLRLNPVIHFFNVYSALPERLNDQARYVFASTDESVVKVDGDGRLAFVGVGIAQVMVHEVGTGLETFAEIEVLPYSNKYTAEEEAQLNSPGLAAGLDFSIALNSEGKVWAFGSNSYGQLGRGPITDKFSSKHEPVVLASTAAQLDGVVSVAAGYNFGLAATQAGNVYAWGQNIRGSLGLNLDVNSEASYPYPVLVKGPGGTGYLGDERTGRVVKVFANGNASAAITERGEVYVWGESRSFQLGAREGAAYYLYPHKVPGIDNAMEIYLSSNNMAVLTADGMLYVSGTEATGLVGLGPAIKEDNTPGITNYTGTAVYPQPILDRDQSAYQGSLVQAGIGEQQSILMSMEYVTAGSDQGIVTGFQADGSALTYREGMLKHLYMLGRQVEGSGVLGPLIEREGLENGMRLTQPTELDYFDGTEYQRLGLLAEDAWSSAAKYTVSLSDEWIAKKAEYDGYPDKDNVPQALKEYMEANPDWIAAPRAALQPKLTWPPLRPPISPPRPPRSAIRPTPPSGI